MAEDGGQGHREGADLGRGRDLRGADQEAVGQGRIVGLRVGQDEPGQDARLEQPAMDGPRVRDADDELVEVRPGMHPLGADGRQGRLQLGRAAGPEGRHVAQAVRADRGQVDRGGERQQGLVGADVAGRLVAADVLLARTHRHDVGALAVQVGRHPDEAAGDLADQGLGRGEDAEIRAAVLRGDPERLALAGRDVRAIRAGRGQDGQADRLDDGDEQGAGGVRQAADLGHRLEQAEEVGLGRDDPGDRPVRVGQHPLEGGEIGRAGGLALGHERDLLEIQAAREVGPGRGPVVGVDAARDEDALAAGRPAGHQRGLGRGRRPVVVRGGHDVEVDQLGQQRLVLVDALEGALADLGLVRRVGRVPLPAQQELVDRGRAPVPVDARPEERGEVGPVPRGERAEPGGQLELGLGLGQVERGRAELGRDVLEELVDRCQAERREHPPAIVGGVGTVRHPLGQPAAMSAS